MRSAPLAMSKTLIFWIITRSRLQGAAGRIRAEVAPAALAPPGRGSARRGRGVPSDRGQGGSRGRGSVHYKNYTPPSVGWIPPTAEHIRALPSQSAPKRSSHRSAGSRGAGWFPRFRKSWNHHRNHRRRCCRQNRYRPQWQPRNIPAAWPRLPRRS